MRGDCIDFASIKSATSCFGPKETFLYMIWLAMEGLSILFSGVSNSWEAGRAWFLLLMMCAADLLVERGERSWLEAFESRLWLIIALFYSSLTVPGVLSEGCLKISNSASYFSSGIKVGSGFILVKILCLKFLKQDLVSNGFQLYALYVPFLCSYVV